MRGSTGFARVTVLMLVASGCESMPWADDEPPPSPLQAKTPKKAAEKAETSVQNDAPPAAPKNKQDSALDEPSDAAPVALPRAHGEDESGLEGTLLVSFRDRQLFHPDSKRPTLTDPRDEEKVIRVAEAENRYALGLVVEAKNDSPYLLGPVRVLSDVWVNGRAGRSRCESVTRGGEAVAVVSAQRMDDSQWGDELRDPVESVWRPQEKIRAVFVLSCGSRLLRDIDIEGLDGSIRLAAPAIFRERDDVCDHARTTCIDDVVSDEQGLTLPAAAFTAQPINLGDSGNGFAVGDILIHVEKDKLRYDTLAEFGLSVFAFDTPPIPEKTEAAFDEIDEWSITVDSAETRSWRTHQDVPKGQRVLAVTANVKINTEGINQRLKEALQAARAAHTSASERADALTQELANAETDSTRENLRDAKKGLQQTARALQDAEREFVKGFAGERKRLGNLVDCGDIRLLTQREEVRPTDAREAGAACKLLGSQDAVQITLSYLVERYDVPVGLAFRAGGSDRMLSLASRELMICDPQ